MVLLKQRLLRLLLVLSLQLKLGRVNEQTRRSRHNARRSRI